MMRAARIKAVSFPYASSLALRGCLLAVLLTASYPGAGADRQEVVVTGLGAATERQLPTDAGYRSWVQTEGLPEEQDADREIRKEKEENVTTVKLQDIVPPIHFRSGKADIEPEYVRKLQAVLDSMRDRTNVRLHFVGHTDNVRLVGDALEQYGDNFGLSRERAGTVAEYFQHALNLPPEAISYDGLGESKPVASNNSEDGRAQNRRVEVEVWYDEVAEDMVDREVTLDPDTRRIRVCRVETVCKLRYREGYSRRARLKNLVPPYHYDEGTAEIPARYLKDLGQALQNLGDRRNVQVHFIGYSDNLPLTGRDERIYGDSVGWSKAQARRVALAVQDALQLPNDAVSSTGKGAGRPVASNDSEKGRALNRRVEVEFWYDDPLEDLPDEPQICPEQSAAETVERIYSPPDGDISPIYFENGQPVEPAGYAQRLKRVMDDIQDKGNVRLRFIGYTANERLDRRTASVYGDDIGLSTARARRAMEQIRAELGLADNQVEFEGRGYVQSHDVVNAGFVELDRSKVEVQVVYDELAILDDAEGLDIERIRREIEPGNPYALNLMRITVDGQPLNDPGKNISDLDRCTDVALDRADIRFKFDNLDSKPRLNVTAWPNVISVLDNVDTDIVENLVHFRWYSNYPAFIDHAEVRLFRADQSTTDDPLAVIPAGADRNAQWQYALADYSAPRLELKYVLRVYDRDGHFDQTGVQTLWVVDELENELQAVDMARELLAGYGENRLALSNIPLSGGMVSVYGRDVPKDHDVWFAGYAIPVSEGGEFAGEMIVPRGLHSVEVSVTDASGNGNVYLRDLEMKSNDWFYVGIADLTAGVDKTDGPAELVTGDSDHYNSDLSVDGRLAFYTRGTFASNWKLTASADTEEGPVDGLFSNFIDKSPDSLFRRIDPDYHMPTYGDDGTVEEDAPTSGKLYAKIEKDKDYGLWGNFGVDYTDTELAHVDRKLYGANVNMESGTETGSGEKKFLVNAFAAEPGTVASREEFRGTSGSLYYLKHQDILSGSERIRVEVRDGVSGMVIGVKNLVYGVDYDIDYLQGRVVLSQPLSATVFNNMTVDSGYSGASQTFLVARYEYTPGLDNIDDIVTGGRVHYWFNDMVKLGGTLEQQDTLGAESNLNGVDLTVRKSAGTWLKLEKTVSEGPVSSASLSNDGGFIFDNYALAPGTDVRADGQRVEASVHLGDYFDTVNGSLTLYDQRLDAGYSAPGQIALTDTSQTGVSLEVPVGESTSVRLKMDSKNQQAALETESAELDVDYSIDGHWTVGAGLRTDSRTDNSPVVPLTQEEGDRSDLALKLEYDTKEKWALYGLVQDTISTTGNRDENGRIGVGGDYRASDRLRLNAELSGGDLGTGVKLGTDYKMTDATELYSNYTLENERSDTGIRAQQGNMATGFRTRYSDSTSVYMEERYTHGDVPAGLTHLMGFDLALTERFNFGGHVDFGTLADTRTGAEIKRKAAGVKAGYKFTDLTYAGALEYRVDDTEQPSTTTAKRTTWLTKNSIKYQVDPDWRLLGRFNHSDSDSSLGEFYDGNYTEAVIGYGYRPVRHDRLDTLLKYTYFYNMPAADQVTVNNTAAEYIQRSHILSLDATYELTPSWSLGGKYAYRMGELSPDRQNPVFFRSDASLYIARVDWRFLSHWSALLEGRMLDLPDAGDTRSGFLVAVNRHFGEHVELGVGYNFTDFSDDLTDLDYTSHGVFINLVGKI